MRTIPYVRHRGVERPGPGRRLAQGLPVGDGAAVARPSPSWASTLDPRKLAVRGRLPDRPPQPSHGTRRLDSRSQLNRLAEAAQGRMREVIGTLTRDVETAGETGTRQPPPAVPPLGQITTGSRDLTSAESRLARRWIYQEFHSSGGFSMRSELHMILLEDGHVVRTTRGVSSSTFRDSSGNWIGSMSMDSGGLEPGERGCWKADGRLLTLEMDDASVYEYRYTLEGSKLLTRNTTGGQERFWTRSRV